MAPINFGWNRTNLSVNLGRTMIFMDFLAGIQAQNEAAFRERSGDFAGVEIKYLQAIELKARSEGMETLEIARPKDELGDLYLKMGKLDDAQRVWEESERIRNVASHSTRQRRIGIC